MIGLIGVTDRYDFVTYRDSFSPGCLDVFLFQVAHCPAECYCGDELWALDWCDAGRLATEEDTLKQKASGLYPAAAVADESAEAPVQIQTALAGVEAAGSIAAGPKTAARRGAAGNIGAVVPESGIGEIAEQATHLASSVMAMVRNGVELGR